MIRTCLELKQIHWHCVSLKPAYSCLSMLVRHTQWNYSFAFMLAGLIDRRGWIWSLASDGKVGTRNTPNASHICVEHQPYCLTRCAVSGITDSRKAVNFSKVSNSVDRLWDHRRRTCSSMRQRSIEISKNMGYQRWGSTVWKYPGTSTIDCAAAH
jgi:hypothetical protein